ncbi:hypothetical protein FRC06_010307, partial [Ceratobasidium sp. 370]
MPRFATLLRPLRTFGSNLATHKSHTQPGEPIRCPHCPRTLKSDGDLTRHLTLRASCWREEERAARIQATSEIDFWSLLEALGHAQVQLEVETRLGEESEVEAQAEAQAEAEAEAEAPEAEVLEAEILEVQARVAEMEVEKLGEPSARKETTMPGESLPGGHAEPGVEPVTSSPSEQVPTAAQEACPPLGTPNDTPHLVFDEKEGDYVESFPDPRAGAPINDKTVPAPDLDAYMAAAGNLGNPFHFSTAELLLTMGLTAGGRDEHLRSHLVLMDDIDKLPHGPGWAVYELTTQVNKTSTKKSYLFTRHIVKVISDVMANPALKKYMHYRPERRYKTADRRNRIYGNPWTAKWWWRTQ